MNTMKKHAPFVLLALAILAIALDGIATYQTIRYAGLGFAIAIVLIVVAAILSDSDDD